jgi:VCBS repeat-containing protein
MATFIGTQRPDTLHGTSGDDRLFGENGNDTLYGNAGKDFLDGGNGSDVLFGGAGDDEIDGGNGQDTVVLGGNRAQYHLTQRGDGSIVVRDLRSGSPDGTDRLVSIERVQFADGTFKIVDLISANSAPLAVADQLGLTENAGSTEVTATLLANDSDADGDAFAITSVQAVSAQGATVTLTGGKVYYDSGSLFAGLQTGQTATDTFTYTITDATGLSSTATATVTIAGITQNAAPAAADDALTLAEDADATDVTTVLLANDSDPEGGLLTITAVQGLSDKGAIVTLGPDGKVSYDPGFVFLNLQQGETATDRFTYTVTDAGGLTSTATAVVTITGITQEPHSTFIVEEDGVSIDMFGILVETLGFEVVGVETQGTIGTVALGDGTLTFTADHPNSDKMLPDNWDSTFFTVLGADGESALVEMIIYGFNDPVTAIDDSITVGEGEASANLWGILMSNDQDLDGLAMVQRIDSVDATGTLGAVSFDSASKSLIYSAAGLDLADGESITDSFTYTVADGFGSTDTATVTVTVTGGSGASFSTSMAGGSGAPAMNAFAPDGAAPTLAAFHGFAAVTETLIGAEHAMIV